MIDRLRRRMLLHAAGCALAACFAREEAAGGSAMEEAGEARVAAAENGAAYEAFMDGSALFYNDQYAECLVMMDAAIAADSSILEAHLMRGLALMKLGRLEEASASYMVYCGRDPEKPQGFNLVGKLLFDYGQYVLAETYFLHAYELAPEDVSILNNLGSAFVRTGKLDRACEIFKKGLDIDPAVSELHLNLGIVHFVEKDLEAAESAFLKAAELNRAANVPDPIAHANLGDVYIEMGELEKAAASFSEALDCDGSMSDVRTRLAMILQYLGQIEPARRQYETAIAVGGALPEAHTGLAEIYLGEGRIRQALRELKSAARLTRHRAPGPLEDLARIHELMGRPSEALAFSRMAFDAGCRSARLLAALSRLCEVDGRDAEAYVYFKLLEEAAETDGAALFEVAKRTIDSHVDRIRDPRRGFEIAGSIAKETGWQHAGVLDVMARACAGLGEFGKAADLQRSAIALVPPGSLFLPELEARLATYAAGTNK